MPAVTANCMQRHACKQYTAGKTWFKSNKKTTRLKNLYHPRSIYLSRPIQQYHFKDNLIWCESTFNRFLICINLNFSIICNMSGEKVCIYELAEVNHKKDCVRKSPIPKVSHICGRCTNLINYLCPQICGFVCLRNLFEDRPLFHRYLEHTEEIQGTAAQYSFTGALSLACYILLPMADWTIDSCSL